MDTDREQRLQKMLEEEKKKRRRAAKILAVVSLSLIAVIAGAMAGYPIYSVWSSQKAGEAQLAEASSNRRIKINEAEAQEEAAQHLAKAEIARARGVAEANKIIGESLKNNDSYLRYLWIQSLSDKDGSRGKEVIYVPTEGNLPILEASRLHAPGVPGK
jgi:flagellar basal body-associated protein FliL